MAPNNPLASWGNDKTMNLNTLILTNIQSSPYFKVQLFELKTFHEVVDEIYYRVDHLEPWEKGSRKTAGQTGMCGGVRGVGAGGIVSSAYCLLFKLFTLKLTKKQVNNLITHADSPYIRGLGFMYIRYSQQPGDLWDWYESYLDDDEELDVKAGGGHMMTIGEMLRQWLVKLEWYSTLFPRIPVPIQKDLDVKLRSRPPPAFGFSGYGQEEPAASVASVKEPEHIPDDQVSFGEAEKSAQSHRGGSGQSRGGHQDSYSNSNGNNNHSNSNYYGRRSPPSRRRSPPRRSPYSRDDFSRDLERERDRQRREREKDSQSKHRDGERDRDRQRSKSRSKSRSRSRDRKASRRSRSKDRQREDKERPREDKEKDHRRDRADRGDKAERGDRGDKAERGDRGDKAERGDRADKAERGDRADKAERGDRGDKAERGDRGDKLERGDRGDKAERGDRGDKLERGDRGDRDRDEYKKEHKKHKKSHKHGKDKSRDKERDSSRERDSGSRYHRDRGDEDRHQDRSRERDRK